MLINPPSYGNWKWDIKAIKRKVRIVENLVKRAQKDGVVFDALVFRGTSGTFLIPHLLQKGLPCVMVRKPAEESHGSSIEGNVSTIHNVIFVDDFICTGSTVDTVKETLHKQYVKMTAIILHDCACQPVARHSNIKVYAHVEDC